MGYRLCDAWAQDLADNTAVIDSGAYRWPETRPVRLSGWTWHQNRHFLRHRHYVGVSHPVLAGTVWNVHWHGHLVSAVQDLLREQQRSQAWTLWTSHLFDMPRELARAAVSAKLSILSLRDQDLRANNHQPVREWNKTSQQEFTFRWHIIVQPGSEDRCYKTKKYQTIKRGKENFFFFFLE